MKALKKLVALVTLSSLSFSYLPFLSFNQPTNIKLTRRNHPEIEGFTYEGGEEEEVYVSGGSSGYRNYNSDYYYSQLTDISRLYIIHVQVNFIPGCIPHYSGHSEYDVGSKLAHGYIHILPYQKKENSFKKILLLLIFVPGHVKTHLHSLIKMHQAIVPHTTTQVA